VSLPSLDPLARWDGLHLVLNLSMVEEWLATKLQAIEQIDEVSLEGAGDTIRVVAMVHHRGVRGQLSVEIAELRLRRRHLGMRLRRLRVLGGVRVPMGVVETIVQRVAPDIVKVFRGMGIVVVDLGRWLPNELSLSVLTVQATQRSLHVWFGPGKLDDLPTPGSSATPALPEGDSPAENPQNALTAP